MTLKITKEVEKLVAEKIADLGVELLEVEFKREPSGRVLRLFIDQPGGVDLSTCEKVSSKVSSLLDEADIIKGSYMLEVSSPGVERRLTKPEHFQKFTGQKIKIQLKEKVNNRKKFTGDLKEANSTGIIIVSEGEKFKFNYEQIEKANLVYDFK